MKACKNDQITTDSFDPNRSLDTAKMIQVVLIFLVAIIEIL